MFTRQNRKINLILVLVITLTVFICMPSFANTTSYVSGDDNTARLASEPIIGNVNVIDMIVEPFSSVTVGWETDLPATFASEIEFQEGLNSFFGFMPAEFDFEHPRQAGGYWDRPFFELFERGMIESQGTSNERKALQY